MVWAAYLEPIPWTSHHAIAEALDQPWAPVRKLWGSTAADKRGHAAMMALAGGPAPPRQPKPAEHTPEVAGSA